MALQPVELVLEVVVQGIDLESALNKLAEAVGPLVVGGSLSWKGDEPLVHMATRVDAATPTDAAALLPALVEKAVEELAGSLPEHVSVRVSVAAVRAEDERVFAD